MWKERDDNEIDVAENSRNFLRTIQEWYAADGAHGDGESEQVVRGAQLFQIQKQKAFDESPEIAQHKQEQNEGHHMGHFH